MPTVNPAEKILSPEQMQNASRNYLRCLNLPPKSQILFITDKLSGNPDDNLLIRNKMVASLKEQIESDYRVLTMEYDGSRAPADLKGDQLIEQQEQLRQDTANALRDLDNLDTNPDINRTTTIVYLGDTWSTRPGIYKAANEFGKDHTVKLAGSLGFSTGDCRVMSNITEEKVTQLYEADKHFEKLFKEHPQGQFKITTRDPLLGEEHELNLNYDTTKADFKPEFGNFDGVHESSLGGSKNVKYLNIPGGERYGTPYPFNKTNGKFSAEGIVFTVKDGLVTTFVCAKVLDLKQMSLSQRELLRKVGEGMPIPVSELGLGFYELAGIETYTDSSTLSHEKSGPHIGMGHTAGDSAEEEDIEKLAGDFHHTDFVMDNPVMEWMNPQGEDRQQFYPPVQ